MYRGSVWTVRAGQAEIRVLVPRTGDTDENAFVALEAVKSLGASYGISAFPEDPEYIANTLLTRNQTSIIM